MRFLLFIATLLVSHCVTADCQLAADHCRKRYTKENAPPEMVYEMFVRAIFVDSLDYLEDLDRLDDDDNYAGWYYVKDGLTPEMRWPDVVRYFIAKFLEINMEADELQKQTMCVDGKPRYDGAENYVIFNQLEEVSLNAWQKHLYLARSDLQASGLFDLDKVLKEFKGTFGVKFMDHRSTDVKQIYELTARLCVKPWGYSVTVSESSEDQTKIQN